MKVEYLFLAGGIIYFVIVLLGIIVVPIIYFLLTVILSISWSIKEVKEKK